MKLAAKTVDGVEDCIADYRTRTAEVRFDPSRTTPEAIAKAISEKTGFKARAPAKADSRVTPGH